MTKSHFKAKADNPDRIEILKEAGGLIVGDRNNEYGEPYDNMKQTLNLIKAYIGDRKGSELVVTDVPLIMICIKLGRLGGNLRSTDSYKDIIGYCAIAYECQNKEKNPQ